MRYVLEKFREQEYKNHKWLVNKAIKQGKLTRPKQCFLCERNNLKINAHHNDYDKPLEVEWLCNRCHIRKHYGIAWNDESRVKPRFRRNKWDPVNNRTSLKINGKQHNMPIPKKESYSLGGLSIGENIQDCHQQRHNLIDWDKTFKIITSREREIISFHCGFRYPYVFTYAEIGRIFKITRSRVQVLAVRAFRKLRKHGIKYK